MAATLTCRGPGTAAAADLAGTTAEEAGGEGGRYVAQPQQEEREIDEEDEGDQVYS